MVGRCGVRLRADGIRGGVGTDFRRQCRTSPLYAASSADGVDGGRCEGQLIASHNTAEMQPQRAYDLLVYCIPVLSYEPCLQHSHLRNTLRLDANNLSTVRNCTARLRTIRQSTLAASLARISPFVRRADFFSHCRKTSRPIVHSLTRHTSHLSYNTSSSTSLHFDTVPILPLCVFQSCRSSSFPVLTIVLYLSLPFFLKTQRPRCVPPSPTPRAPP